MPTNSPINIYHPIMSIGAVAEELELAVQTIRLYEQAGLVRPARTKTGRRLYSLHDLDRLKCARNMIKDYGMNLQGIKRMLSLLPCWEIKGGLDDDCKQCPAFYEATGPCWSLSQVGEKCRTADCRECAVYRMQLSCEKMKEVIYGNKRPKQHTK